MGEILISMNYCKKNILKNKNFGLNNDTKYRYHVCYTNINDLNTEKHILVYHKK